MQEFAGSIDNSNVADNIPTDNVANNVHEFDNVAEDDLHDSTIPEVAVETSVLVNLLATDVKEYFSSIGVLSQETCAKMIEWLTARADGALS